MIQFFIVMIVIGGVAAYFWGPAAAIKLGPQVLDYWILAGLTMILLSPFLGMYRLIKMLFIKLRNSFRSSSGKNTN